jgi:hypothetical protein
MVYYLGKFGGNKSHGYSLENVFSGNSLYASVGIPLLVVALFLLVVVWKKPERLSKVDKDGKKVVDWKKTLLWAALVLVGSLVLTFVVMKYGISDSAPALVSSA